MIRDPLLARLGLVRMGHEQGPDGFTPSQSQQHVLFTPPGNHRRGARASRTLGREDLGDHATLADRGARTAGHGL
ncbi:hypothetical protein SDC9_199483 [bioreactor metagenome]|uniref:Uncharacterized protein n=1 Tax=bioreactor metagenome TaxID=1076179 RepID=A0A645IXB1_9ZZZZ